MGFPDDASGKDPSYHCRRDIGDTGSMPGWGRYSRGGSGNPLQYSCLKNSMDTEAWQALIHRVPKCLTRLKQLSTHTGREYIWGGM